MVFSDNNSDGKEKNCRIHRNYLVALRNRVRVGVEIRFNITLAFSLEQMSSNLHKNVFLLLLFCFFLGGGGFFNLDGTYLSSYPLKPAWVRGPSTSLRPVIV